MSRPSGIAAVLLLFSLWLSALFGTAAPAASYSPVWSPIEAAAELQRETLRPAAEALEAREAAKADPLDALPPATVLALPSAGGAQPAPAIRLQTAPSRSAPAAFRARAPPAF